MKAGWRRRHRTEPKRIGPASLSSLSLVFPLSPFPCLSFLSSCPVPFFSVFLLFFLSTIPAASRGRNIFDNRHKARPDQPSATVRRRLKGKTGPLSEKAPLYSDHFPLCPSRYILSLPVTVDVSAERYVNWTVTRFDGDGWQLNQSGIRDFYVTPRAPAFGTLAGISPLRRRAARRSFEKTSERK